MNIRNRIVGHEDVAPDQLLAHELNFRRHPGGQAAALRGSMKELGWVKTILVNQRTGKVIDGHLRVEEAMRQGLETVPVTYVDLDEGEERKALALLDPISGLAFSDMEALDQLLAEVDTQDQALQDLFNQMQAGFQPAQDGGASEVGEPGTGKTPGSLVERFGVPPFSILDTRQGYWRERKQSWLSLGIQSEVGRGGAAVENTNRTGGLLFRSWTASDPGFYGAKTAKEAELGRELDTREFYENYYTPPDGKAITSGTSIFDPVLCELAYRWFCPKGGHVLDPFAGGSVRGVVAGILGRNYTGIELRPEQVEANRAQAADIVREAPAPQWLAGDSRSMDKLLPKGYAADMVLSCPPYADLEVYSDDPADLSNMDYTDFLDAYREIISKAVARLRDNAFIVWVVGEVRDKRTGNYLGFIPDTVRAFVDAGAEFYGEYVLANAIGSAAIRSAGMFEASRKLCKIHQNVLVFVKGDPVEATKRVGPVEFGEIQVDPADDDAPLEDPLVA